VYNFKFRCFDIIDERNHGANAPEFYFRSKLVLPFSEVHVDRYLALLPTSLLAANQRDSTIIHEFIALHMSSQHASAVVRSDSGMFLNKPIFNGLIA